jgi:Ca2+-binding RTX toxin-like protein
MGEGSMRLRGMLVTLAAAVLVGGAALLHGVIGSVAGARAECTITDTAANDTLNGTTRDDVICAKAGSDTVNGLEGNDVIRGGQGDDGGGAQPGPQPSPTNGPAIFSNGLSGGDGSDVVKGQADDDSIQGNGQNDTLSGGQGDDCLGRNCISGSPFETEQGNDTMKSRDKVSGNDYVDAGDGTDTCRIDAGDQVHSCEL